MRVQYWRDRYLSDSTGKLQTQLTLEKLLSKAAGYGAERVNAAPCVLAAMIASNSAEESVADIL